MRPRYVALAGALLALVAGCGSARQDVGAGQGDGAGPTVAEPKAVTTPAAGDCPPHDPNGRAAIDWVPFVRVGGLMFQATYSPATPTTVPESQLGETVLTVECTISETVNNPDYRPSNGDAAFLPVGTELRAVDGYRPDFRLAAWEDGAWRLYEVDDVPDATVGEDMLDLRDKVVAVHLVEGDRGESILRTVDDEAQVASLVDAVLRARVVSEKSNLYERLGDESPVFVRFDLRDGTSVQRAWHVEAGLLWRRITAPRELVDALAPRRA
jgi:hypothetical protein